MVDEAVRYVAQSVLQRAEEYKKSVEIVIKNYNKKLQETDQEVQKILEQLDRQQGLNKEAVGMIGKATEELKLLEIENIHLEESVGGLKNELWLTKEKLEEVAQSREKLQHALDEQKQANEELEEKLLQTSDKMNELEELTKKASSLETRNQSYKKKCDLFRGKASEFEKEIQELSSTSKNFSEQCERYEDLFTRYKFLEYRNAQLEETVLRSEKLMHPFKSQLEAYSAEKQKIIEDSTDTEVDANKIDLKYNEIIKHHTEKEAIKDMIKLKEKDLELVKRRLQKATFLTQTDDTNENDA